MSFWQVWEWGERLGGGRLGPVSGGQTHRGQGEAEEGPGHRHRCALSVHRVHHHHGDDVITLCECHTLLLLSAHIMSPSRVLCASVGHWLDTESSSPGRARDQFLVTQEAGSSLSRGQAGHCRQLTLRRNTGGCVTCDNTWRGRH